MGKLLLLHCAESGKKALDRMAPLGHALPEGVRPVELPCTGRVNEALLLDAFQDDVDGIMVLACHKENCKYLDGNLRAEKRVNRVKTILADAGIQNKTIEILFIAPDEGRKLARNIDELLYKRIEIEHG